MYEPQKRYIYSFISSFTVTLLLLMTLFFPLFTKEVEASDTGFKSPTATGEDYNQWTNPTNAYSSNDVYASASPDGSVLSQDYYNFDFNVPSGSTIDGIEVSVEGYSSSPEYELNVWLSWDGGSTGTDCLSRFFSDEENTQTYGSDTNTWGRSWSSTEFSNSNFRLVFETVTDKETVYIDHVQVKIYYTSSGNTAPVVSSPNPSDLATQVGLELSGNSSCFNVTVNDIEGNTMNITWYANIFGEWIEIGSNTSITNGTYRCYIVDWVTDYNKTYSWNVSVNDGLGGYTNKTYNFTTNGTLPYVLSSYPNDGDTYITGFPPTVETVIRCDSNKYANVSFRSNYTGAWTTYQTNNTVYDMSTLYWVFSGADTGNQYWYWSANISDGTNWYNQTFNFGTWSYPTEGYTGVYKFLEYSALNGYMYNRSYINWWRSINATQGNTSSWLTTYAYCRNYGSTTYRCERIFLLYDTSNIPDNAVINSVNISFPTLIKYGTESARNWYIRNSSSGNTIELTDFNRSRFGANYSNYSWSGALTGVNVSFNENVSTSVNKSGVSTYVIQYWYDRWNATPDTGSPYGFGCDDETNITLWVNYTANYPEINPSSNETPVNNTFYFDVPSYVNCTAYVRHNSSSTMNVTIYTSTDNSSWTLRKHQTGVLNETVFYNITSGLSWNNTYWWKVYANDSYTNVSRWFRFDINGYFPYIPLYFNGTDFDDGVDQGDNGSLVTCFPYDSEPHNPIGGYSFTAIWCGTFFRSYLKNNSTCDIGNLNTSADFKINNVYYHIFIGDNSSSPTQEHPTSWVFGYNTSYLQMGSGLETISLSASNNALSMLDLSSTPDWTYINLSTPDIWYLNKTYASFSNVSGMVKNLTFTGVDGSVSLITNYSMASWIIINVPDGVWNNTDSRDTDSDGLTDYQELSKDTQYFTNPFVSDTDGDGYSDSEEISASTNPNNYTDYPAESSWQIIDNEINGSIYNSSVWNIFSNTINGSIYNSSSWNIFSNTINGSIYNSTSSWTIFSNTINGSIYNTSVWTSFSTSINGSIYNSTSTWNIFSNTINGSIYNNTPSWTIINNDINGSIYNQTSSWTIISSSINGSIYNSSSWNTISTSFNGSIYNSTSVWNIFSNTINGSIYNSTSSWNTISSSINGSIYNSTSSWNIISTSINGSIYNNSGSWTSISSSINGSIYNSTSSWNTISTSINGSIYNSTSAWTIINNAINGSIYNTSTWNTISTSINGSIYNSTSSWNTISATINGSIFNNTGVWAILSSSINGSIYNSSGVFTIISNSINGSIYNNTANWNIISNAINGSIYNNSTYGWTIISSDINGSIYNNSNWNTVSTSINGSIYNNSGNWNIISSSINGSIYNISSSWNIISLSINGSIYNISGNWNVISSSINGSIYNSSSNWNIISSSINGSIYNISYYGWTIISSDINGSIYNSSGSWNIISSSINGSIYNVSNWNIISSSINGSIYNTSSFGWTIIDNSINGSIYNVSNWNTISNTINGSIYNASGNWNTVSTTINGSIYNSSSSWNIFSNTINGSIYNNSVWNIFSSSINGSIYNTTYGVWQIISSSINGSIYNYTGSWNKIDTNINGSIYNSTSSWTIISNTINGSIYNITSFNIISNTINGSIYNNSGSWTIINNNINGSIYNISADYWTTISSSINGSIYNATIFNIISNNINGSIYNVSVYGWTIIDNSINGSIWNATIDYIEISGIFPNNNSYNINVQPTIYFTINQSLGRQMNVTLYYGLNISDTTHLLGSEINITNSTISKLNFNASSKATRYWWRAYAEDGVNILNETFCFFTEGGIYLPKEKINVFSILGLFGLFAFILVIVWTRKKKNQ